MNIKICSTCRCLQTVTVEVSDEKAVKRSSVRSSQSPVTFATCKMLNCDTISQAKAKALDTLYANTPFSCRPSVDDVELCESWKTFEFDKCFSRVVARLPLW